MTVDAKASFFMHDFLCIWQSVTKPCAKKCWMGEKSQRQDSEKVLCMQKVYTIWGERKRRFCENVREEKFTAKPISH
jgi:hypothetical protein